METEFKVRVGEFEGPLELLLDLIEKRKLHISDVSLSSVADEFIEHVKSYQEFPINDSADFILIASTLLLIKSKSLLPNLDLTEEEKGSIEDLENRLALYKKYKALAGEIGKIFGNFLYFARENRGRSAVFSPTSEITLLSLKDALHTVLQNIPAKIEALPKVIVQKIISLEEMIESLSKRIEDSLKMSFSSFASRSARATADKKDFLGMDKEEKLNVIVSFLAMLELVKQGLIRVSQSEHFEDISIETDNVGVPFYS